MPHVKLVKPLSMDKVREDVLFMGARDWEATALNRG